MLGKNSGQGGIMKQNRIVIGLLGVFIVIFSIARISAKEELVIQVKNTNELVNAINESNKQGGNATIELASGTYVIDSLLHIYTDNIIVMSATNNYNDVTIKGAGMYGDVSHIFLVAASGFSVKGISLGEVKNHVIQVQGENGASHVNVINCRLYDSFEQLLKVSGKGENGKSSTDGLVENCLFEYTNGIGPQYYIGGVDAHYSMNWIIRGNTFKDIISPEADLAEHAIHFWSDSSGTLIENNVIIRCDRGIGFGMGSSAHGSGIIRNNSIHTTRDVGIGLESAKDIQVYGNQVYTLNYDNSIEYRFEGTVAIINNNITTGNILKRNEGNATVTNNLKLDKAKWTLAKNGEATPVGETPSTWALTAIKYLKVETNIKEELYTHYKENITRKDFAYLSVALYEEVSGKQAPEVTTTDLDIFTDTQDIEVLKAYKLGIIQGYGNKLFGPNDLVTREQVAVMFIKTLNAAEVYLSDAEIDKISFVDQSKMSSWAIKAIKIAYKHGIMNGIGGGLIEPKANTTREQGLVLVYNVLDKRDGFTTMEKPSDLNDTVSKEQINVDNTSNLIGISAKLRFTHGGSYNSWAETGWYSTPAVADLDHDGKNEIIASAYSIVVLDESTGAVKWRVSSGHDRSEPDAESVGRTWSDIVVEDIDNDGELEIITAHSGGVVSVYNGDGYFKTGWPQNPTTRELRGLKVYDIDLDGTYEIIVTGAVNDKENIWVYEHTGELRAGWPQLSNDRGYAYGVFNNNVSVGNLTGDKKLEIVVPSDVHYICAYDTDGTQLQANSIYGDKKWGEVGVWESLSTEIRGWGEDSGLRDERYRANFAHGASVITDVNNDGINEVVVIGNVYDSEKGHPPGLYNGVYIFNADRSRFKNGYFNWETVPVDTGAPLSEDYDVIENNQPDPVVKDLNGDGISEILFSSYDGKVHCYSLDKLEHDNWPFNLSTSSEIEFASVPEVIDLNGDGFMEVVFSTWKQKNATTNGLLYILDYKGNVLLKEELPDSKGNTETNGGLASPYVGDIDENGDIEIIINSVGGGFIVYDLRLNP